MIKDLYGRPITSLRISVTPRCNLHCFYCHQEGEDHKGCLEMTVEEIQRIVSLISAFGVRQIKLTGGEPLLRNDILEIVRRIKLVSEGLEVSMTTNGVLLGDLAKPLREAGLTRVNVSLDTLNPKMYETITGVNAFESVRTGIDEAIKAELSPVKANMVLLRGVNDEQVWDMIDFSGENDLILQLIELESANENLVYRRYHMDLTEIEEELGKCAKRIIVRSMHHRKKYLLPSGAEVEVVKPMHNTEFCKYCTRIRVTSDGKFKPCLFRSDNLVDFLSSMRNQASDEILKDLFLKAVKRRKPYFM